MTPEEKSLLERTYKMTEENNTILRKMRRASRISTIFRIVYWVVIIGLGLGTYYFLQPYLISAVDVLKQGQSTLQKFGGMTSYLPR